MENKIYTEQFYGVNIFNWKEWDIVDVDNFYFYNVEFLLPSMQKYNGMDVRKWFDGKMEVYCDSKPNADEPVPEVVWSGYVTDIQEVKEALNKKLLKISLMEVLSHKKYKEMECEADDLKRRYEAEEIKLAVCDVARKICLNIADEVF